MTLASPSPPPSPSLPLPHNVSSRLISTPDLTFHILESGATPAKPNDRPLILLLHGFPEIAYSWRRILPKLAQAGYHAVAPDQRGFGRTTGWDTRPFKEVDLHSFSLTNLVRDIIVLVHALGYRSVQCVVGHDCGAITASLCALMRPDFFHSVVLMSHPFNGSPTLPFNTANANDLQGTGVGTGTGTGTGILEDHSALAEKGGGGGAEGSAAASGIHKALAQSGRKHYKWYYSTEEANSDMSSLTPEDLHRFLRGYFHLKSGSWAGNQPKPLKGWTVEEVVQMPYYYIMPLHDTMPQAVEKHMLDEPSQGKSSYSWLPEDELAVYVAEYARTGFQGGLNWYRVRTAAGGIYTKDYDLFAGKKIEVPCSFISGAKDWGTYQEPGALEKMTSGAVCSDFRTLKVLDGVGHWIPQEAPDEVVETIIDLTKDLA